MKKMKKAFIKIWNSKNRRFFFFLFCVFVAGIFLYFDRPSVVGENDTIEIKGTLKNITQELVYSQRIKKTERDSTYHIFLNEYPCYFQVSYFPYDRKNFYSTSKRGDIIDLHIARQDSKKLNIPNQRVRSFSLKVNSRTYLALNNGLSGFGKGYFELGMIFIPLIIMTILTYKTLNNK
jgi:hypothetical protein